MTTMGFLPPSSRHALCRWRPASSPIRRPTADEPVKPTLSTRPSSSAADRPVYVVSPSLSTTSSTPLRHPALAEELEQRQGHAGRRLGRLPHDGVAAEQGGHEVPGGDGSREVRRRDDGGDADRHAKREELLVGHLARHGHAVEPSALAEEEVAGVDDLLHLAQRLGVRLPDLAGDEPGEGRLVVLDEAPDLGDDATADRRRHARPLLLGVPCPPGGVDERCCVDQVDRGDDVLEIGRVAGDVRAHAADSATPAVLGHNAALCR